MLPVTIVGRSVFFILIVELGCVSVGCDIMMSPMSTFRMIDERLLIIGRTRIYRGILNNPSKPVPISTLSTKNSYGRLIVNFELRFEMSMNVYIGAAMSCIVMFVVSFSGVTTHCGCILTAR